VEISTKKRITCNTVSNLQKVLLIIKNASLAKSSSYNKKCITYKKFSMQQKTHGL
jgi:hypothetical protein